MRISAALVLLVALLTGCSTKVTYKPKLEAGPAKSSTDIMCVYLKDAEIPRPFEVIGLVHVGDSGITAAWEGTLDKVLNKLMVTAREKGADGVQIIALRAPGDFSSIFRVKANLIRFTDKWEMSGMSETDFLVYLEQNQKTIEPIEGVWTYNGSQPLRVAIKKDSTRPGRDYAGFVLPQHERFQTGRKLLDISRLPHSSAYACTFYHPDFVKEDQTIVLNEGAVFSIPIHTIHGNDILTFVKTLPRTLNPSQSVATATNSPVKTVQQ